MNEGPGMDCSTPTGGPPWGGTMDKKDGHWNGIKHGEIGARTGKDNGASSGDFRTLKPP